MNSSWARPSQHSMRNNREREELMAKDLTNKQFLIRVIIALMAGIISGILFATLTGCGAMVSDKDALKAVEDQGFADPKIIDKDITFIDWRGCSKEDDAAYEVEATNAQGKRVTLTVCVGWPFKGATIRSK